jgi:hypothetical protein
MAKRRAAFHPSDEPARQPARRSQVNPNPVIPTGDVRHMPWIREGKIREIRNTKKEADKLAHS